MTDTTKPMSKPESPIRGLSQTEFDLIITKQDPAWSHILTTPFLRSRKLGAITGCDLWIKYENLQFTGAFKERGALAKLLSLSDDQKQRGVIAASAGNHAQGLARNAGLLNIAATIVMPKFTPFVKVQQTENLGATVILEGDDFDQANAVALAKCKTDNTTYIHPFDDPHVIAGQGTIAAEMLSVAPDLDVLLVPIGGGGLLAGMAIVARQLRPDLEIIGVQAELYPSMANAVNGTDLPIGGMSLAEGIAVRQPGAITTNIIRTFVNDIVTVSERHLERALSLYLNVQKTLAEGAGAAGLAAILADPKRFKAKKVGTLITGGNIDTRLLSSILMRDLHRQGRIARLRIELMDVPGQLTLVSDLISTAGGNVIDVSYHRIFNDLPAKATYLDISVETNDGQHLERVIACLRAANLVVETANY